MAYSVELKAKLHQLTPFLIAVDFFRHRNKKPLSTHYPKGIKGQGNSAKGGGQNRGNQQTSDSIYNSHF